jgi:hypothetical protein
MKRQATYRVVNKAAGAVMASGLSRKSAQRLSKAANAKNPGRARVERE